MVFVFYKTLLPQPCTTSGQEVELASNLIIPPPFPSLLLQILTFCFLPPLHHSPCKLNTVSLLISFSPLPPPPPPLFLTYIYCLHSFFPLNAQVPLSLFDALCSQCPQTSFVLPPFLNPPSDRHSKGCGFPEGLSGAPHCGGPDVPGKPHWHHS